LANSDGHALLGAHQAFFRLQSEGLGHNGYIIATNQENREQGGFELSMPLSSILIWAIESMKSPGFIGGARRRTCAFGQPHDSLGLVLIKQMVAERLWVRGNDAV
jgi:hypothetical protein